MILSGKLITSLYTSGTTIYAGTPDGVYRQLEDGSWWYEEGSSDRGTISAFAEFGGTLYAAALGVDEYRTGGLLREEDGIWYVVPGFTSPAYSFALRYAGRETGPALVVATKEGLFEFLKGEWQPLYLGGTVDPQSTAYFEYQIGPNGEPYDCVGHLSNGITCVEQGNPVRSVRFTAKIWGPHGLPGDAVTALLPGSVPGTLVALFADGGMAQLEIRKEDRFTTVSEAVELEVPITAIQTFGFDIKGRLWIAGAEGAAYRYGTGWKVATTSPVTALAFQGGITLIGTQKGIIEWELK